MGIGKRLGFGRLRESLGKTRDQLVGSVTRILTAKAEIDHATQEELEEVLIRADVGVNAAAEIITGLEEAVRKKRYTDPAELHLMFRQQLLNCLTTENSGDPSETTSRRNGTPHVILVVGVNGVGKTTTIGKLAHLFARHGKKVMVAASDTFRAAANQQLAVWAGRAGAEIVMQKQGADPGAVAFDALQSARAGKTDILLVDTAGRLHTRANLMNELEKIGRVLRKHDPSAPHEVLLVIDANTGQNGLSQARQFTGSVGVTGLVLTKLDGTARGGIVFAIASELDIPVQYIGVGEEIDDLEVFNREEFVDALFQ